MPFQFLRDYQKTAIKKIEELIDSGYKYILLQSPTGSGKTLISLSLSHYLDCPTHVAVRTTYQLRQFIKDNIKFFNQIPITRLNKTRTCRSFGICSSCKFAVHFQDLRELIDILKSNDYDPYSIINYYFAKGICPYYAFSTLYYHSNIFLTTYPYVTTLQNITKVFLERYIPSNQELLNNFKLLIIDESHNILEFPVSDFSLPIKNIVDRVKEEIKLLDKLGIYPERALKIYEEVAKILYELFYLKPEPIYFVKEFYQILESRLYNYIEDLYFLSTNLPVTIKNNIKSRGARLSDVKTIIQISDLLRFTFQYTNSISYLITYEPYYKSITFKLVNYKYLKEYLEYYDYILLMSGSNLTKEEFSKLFNVPLDEVGYVEVKVNIGKKIFHFNYSYTSLYYKRRDHSNITNLIKFLENKTKEIKRTKYKAIVMFPSKEEANFFHKFFHIDYVLDEPSLTYHDVFEKFRQGYVGIFTYPSSRLIEGIEFTDEKGRSLIRYIFVIGIPYPPPPSVSKETKAIIMANKIKIQDYLLMKARMNILQVIGRGTRHPEDEAHIYFIDKRYQDEEIRKRLGLRN